MKPVRTRTRFGRGGGGRAGRAWSGRRSRSRAGRCAGIWPRCRSRWVIAAVALWGGAFVLSLVAALVPRRGDVLPAPSRASRSPARRWPWWRCSRCSRPSTFRASACCPAERGWTLFESCVHCIGTVGKVAAVFLIVGLLALRRLVPVGGSRVGMALGAAGGAMGGLLLVFICPFATAAHVVLGHVGGMVLAAVAGALLMRVTARYAVAIALLALMLATA